MGFQFRKRKRSISFHVFLAACLALCGCGPSLSLAERIPASVKGGWTRSTIAAIPSSEWPKETVEAVRVKYSGPGVIQVEIYQMTSGPSAFEAVQTWRSVPGKIVNWRHDLFLVFAGDNPDALRAFSEAFAKTLPE